MDLIAKNWENSADPPALAAFPWLDHGRVILFLPII